MTVSGETRNPTRADRRLAAIVAADVAGFSRLVGDDEEATLAALSAHRTELVDPILRAHGGRIANTAGDSLLMEFPSAVDALRCALQIQAGMAERNKDVEPSRRISFRIGINVGDVIADGGDLLGNGVNVAARLEGLAAPGGIVLSRSARDQVRDQVDIPLHNEGEVTVKNIARPVRVFRYAPEGASNAKTQPPRPRRLSRRLVIAAGFALLACAAGLGAWLVTSQSQGEWAEPSSDFGNTDFSIAVLPFDNRSGDPEQVYFADALTEDLTVDLSRISGSFVISRSTAASYAGQRVDARQVALELGVRYLLEGTVLRGEDEVRVNVHLIDGNTGQQIWSERYEKKASDMYTFQNEVTGRIARSLNLELKEAMSRQAARAAPENIRANDLALRAWAEIWNKPQNPQTNHAGLEYAGQALELDPDNAEALGVVAYAYARAATYGWVTPTEEAIRMGIAAGERAVEIDPKNPDAIYALGFLRYLQGDTRSSLELMRQCIALNRNHAPAYFFSGLNLIRLGKPREAIQWVNRAFALSPRDPLRSVWFGIIGRAQILLGEDEQAIETARKGIVANAKHPHNHAVLASAYAHLGRAEEAKTALDSLVQLQPEISLGLYRTQIAGDEPVAIDSYKRFIDGLAMAGLPD